MPTHTPESSTDNVEDELEILYKELDAKKEDRFPMLFLGIFMTFATTLFTAVYMSLFLSGSPSSSRAASIAGVLITFSTVAITTKGLVNYINLSARHAVIERELEVRERSARVEPR